MTKVLGFSGALVLTTLMVASPLLAQTQDSAAIWRIFAEKVEVGTRIKVRLRDERPFTATLVDARPDALLLQPKTRLPVPVRPVAYVDIVSIERDKGRIGAGKAAAIGVASGAGAFVAILVILMATLSD